MYVICMSMALHEKEHVLQQVIIRKLHERQVLSYMWFRVLVSAASKLSGMSVSTQIVVQMKDAREDKPAHEEHVLQVVAQALQLQPL